MLLVQSVLAGYTLELSPAERAAGALSATSTTRAAALLDTHGVCVLTGAPLSSATVKEARSHSQRELALMHDRLRSVGIDPSEESFSFAEIVHRSRLRYDVHMDMRRTAADAPWEELSAAARAFTAPIMTSLCESSKVLSAAEGVITSLPGAPAQKFHIDGRVAGSFNVIVPLVDCAAGGARTEFWLGSHRNPVVEEIISRGELAVSNPEELPATAGSIIRPALSAGDCVIYDYRVVHRGPANSGATARPFFYTAWSDVRGNGDGYNFPRRSLAELERRLQLFGPLSNLRGGAASAAGSPGPLHPLAPAPAAAATAAHPPLLSFEPGDVLALFHAFAVDAEPLAAPADPSHLRGFFRTQPCDGESIYLGPAPIEPSAEPNCILAPSADGGRTRRLRAIRPIAAGETPSVPCAFDLERLAGPIAEAVSHAADSHTVASDAAADQDDPGRWDDPGALVREAGADMGRGVFATRSYDVGDLVASWPCRVVPDGDVPPGLIDYAYTSPQPGTSLMVFGHGMLYNHGEGGRSNIAWGVPTDAHLVLTGVGEVQFFASRAIRAGDQLLASYSREYWDSRGVVPKS
jgi:hypothetical protein